MVAMQVNRGRAQSLFINGLIVGIFGCTRIHPGVGECWALLAKDIYRYPKATTKIAKKLVADNMEIMKLHRMQVTTLNADTRAKKWLKCLGFEEEGVMRMFGPDKQDFVRYAKWIQ